MPQDRWLVLAGALLLLGAAQAQDEWWQPHVERSKRLGPYYLQQFPYDIKNDPHSSPLELLCMSGVPEIERTGVAINVGLPRESEHWAKFGLSVVGFEPRREEFEALERVFKAREVPNVSLIHAALSNESGLAELHLAADSSSIQSSAITQAEVPKWEADGRRTEKVPLMRLDEVVQRADVLKIDTQAHEPEVLMGAQAVLENSPSGLPVVVMEFCGRFREFSELMRGLHLLRGLGYQCFMPANEGMPQTLLMSVPEAGEWCGDVYCMRRLNDVGIQRGNRLPQECTGFGFAGWA